MTTSSRVTTGSVAPRRSIAALAESPIAARAAVPGQQLPCAGSRGLRRLLAAAAAAPMMCRASRERQTPDPGGLEPRVSALLPRHRSTMRARLTESRGRRVAEAILIAGWR